MSHSNEKILIVGAGLCGSLLGLTLARKGYEVELVEKRKDLRKNAISAGRSINLALSDRGIQALESAGLKDKIEPLIIPMKGRMIHDKEGNVFLSPYSGREGDSIKSISRKDLNALLLDEAEKHQNVKIKFNQSCEKINAEKGIAYFHDDESQEKYQIESDFIFGTDGAGSAVRKSFGHQANFLFSHSIDYLTHGYKELEFLAAENGGFQIEKNALHIWPRGEYMLIALANTDGSFTVTLFLPHNEGKYNFLTLENPQVLVEFFKEEFNDAYALMPDLLEQYYSHPIGNLGTVKCEPWAYKNKALLLGDAAHAVVPFYGQGMNASFEDVYLFNLILEENGNKIENSLQQFAQKRKIDGDAIGDLAVENYFEMRDHVANPIFKDKRKIEIKLESEFPDRYYSKYSMVTFRPDMPYHQAMKIGRMQDQVLIRLLDNKEIETEMPADVLLEKIQKAIEQQQSTKSIAEILKAHENQ